MADTGKIKDEEEKKEMPSLSGRDVR